MPELTIDTLIDVRNRLSLTDTLVYAVHESLPPGKALLMEETEYFYGCVLFASEDDARLVAEQTGRTLLHLRDAPMKPMTFAGRRHAEGTIDH